MWSSVETSSEAPVSRCKHAAALTAGGVLLLGGRGSRGTTPLTDCWHYSLGSGEWRRVGHAGGTRPPALQEHSAVEHAGRLYVFGGEPAPSYETPLWVLDLQTEEWRKLPGSPAAVQRRGVWGGVGGTPGGRRGHTAHALPDCMLLYGGYMDLRGSTSELWAFNYECETWQLVRTVRCGPARHRHAAALRHQRLYVHGGQCDLTPQRDLWFYDTISHVWSLVRTPPKLSPAARSGHAGLGVGPHFYIYGGDVDGHPTNELWRFHFDSETWERMEQSLQWPAPRADCCALVVTRAPPGATSCGGASQGRRPRPDSLLARLGSMARRGDYRALAAVDSSESIGPLPKSQSAHAVRAASPRRPRVPAALPRDRVSVPDFTDTVLPKGLVSPVEATRLVYFDSDEEEDLRHELSGRGTIPTARPHTTNDDEQTSDYASAERVAPCGFSNPHYQWAADICELTPDSGTELELRPLRSKPARPPRPAPTRYMLLLGGREAHPARHHAPLSVWVCQLP